MVSRSPEGRDRVPQYVFMIGDPLALRIHTPVGRATPEQVAAVAGAPTSFLADAQQGWNCMDVGIRPLDPDMRFAGIAVTASGGPRDNLAAIAALDVVAPGDVLVLATGRDESGAVIGDHYAAVAKQKGVVGIVTDGLVRDAAGVRAKGPPTFSRGLRPNAGYPNGPGELNGPVSVGDVVVQPGDIVVADEDGVVVVPRVHAERVISALADVQAKEDALEEQMARGEITTLWDRARYAERGVEEI